MEPNNQTSTQQPIQSSTVEQSLPNPNDPSKRGKKKFLFGIAILLLTAIFFVIANFILIELGLIDVDRNLVRKLDPLPSPTTLPDPTADWKTYTNMDPGYTMIYPSSWKIRTDEFEVSHSVIKSISFESPDYKVAKPGLTGGVPGANSGMIMEVIVSKNPNFTSFEQYKKNEDEAYAIYPLLAYESISNGKIDNFPAVIQKGGKPYSGRLNNAYTYKDGTIFEFYFTSSDNQDLLFEQILSTFKFTDSDPTPTCVKKPDCVDSEPRCMIPEPAEGWCP